jgi:glycosyltransferase involved in cell wall biosynthesis
MPTVLNRENIFTIGGHSPRLRVALITSSLSLGGAEKQTVYIARALVNAGIDVRVFHLGGAGHYEAALRQMDVPVCQLYRPNKPWAILLNLIRVLRRWRPDTILVSQFGDLVYGVIAGRCCGALTLGGVRSNGSYEFNVRGHLSRWLFRLGHGFIANSYGARQNLVCRGIKARKIEVLSNVIDLNDFDAQGALPSNLTLPASRVIVAAVGSLQPCKRFDRFIEALALAQRREPTILGIIAGGDRGAKAALEERASALGLTDDHLLWLGESDRVPALLTQADMLVLSSDYEGFPNVILEAMAARLPVITTPAGDARRIVQHGKTGYVVEPEDIEGMAAFVVQLAQTPSVRKRFGEAGRHRVEQEYNFGSLPDRLMAIIRTFATQRRRTSVLKTLSESASAKKAEVLSETLGLEIPAV